MQIKGLHKNIYKLARYSLSQEKLEEHRKLYEYSVKLWDKLKSEGVSDRTCVQATQISRATYYRYKAKLAALQKGILPLSRRPWKTNKPQWGEAERQRVLEVRRENPTYGKAKIAVILRRDFDLEITESTTGRILKSLMDKGLITKSASAMKSRRKRNFNKSYAKPWKYKDYIKMKIGERVQIDHMSVSKNGIPVKHFQAWERKSKHMTTGIYCNAKSKSAKQFLRDLVKNAPFPILSIQVDGGSEFRDEFESECKILKIPLIVLPPSSPKYNGGVERANRVFREEFYGRHDLLADSIAALRFELNKATLKYNNYRPHSALKGLTPMQYIQNNLIQRNDSSHIT